jgi:hypothetical protein
MQFVLCNDETYKNLYFKNYQTNIRMSDSRDFTSHFGVRVIVHADDADYEEEMHDLELLNDYKVIKLSYYDDPLRAYWMEEDVIESPNLAA